MQLSAWPPLPPSVWVRQPREHPPFPLGDRRCRLYSRGRHALWHGLRAYGLGPDDAVLAPAYHHGSEIEVLVRLGVECRFYELTDRLEPDSDELDLLLAPHVRALHIIHYLGYPQDALRWRRWCDERGLLLIEDAAMAWLATTPDGPVGSHADVAIFCLYKSFGLPDGGALVSRRPPPANAAGGDVRPRAVAGLHLAWVRQRLPSSERFTGRTSRGDGDAYDPERDFALEDPDSPFGAGGLLLRVADRDAATRRRANARLLLESLGECVAPPFDEVPSGAAPFAFPLTTNDKAGLLERLARRGITALDFWSVPHPALPVDRFPGAAARRATTVALPVHQELARADVERIAAAARRQSRKHRDLRLKDVPSFDEARDAWQRLALRTRNIFATWEWATTWWRHFGGERSLQLVLCESARGEAVGILPLCVSSERRLRTARFVGHGPADQLGPVCALADAPAVARALRRSLHEPRRRVDLFVGDYLSTDEGWSAMLGARAVAREASPVLDIRTTAWDSFLEARSGNLRQQLRRKERRLEREHEVRYRLCADPDRLDTDFDLLCALHARRWPRGHSDAFTMGRRAFLQDFARVALGLGWLRLWFLELDGEPVAGWLGFRYCGVESYYQAGRDPAWNEWSVGTVLLAHTVRAAISDGMSEYRFLRGGEAYKDRFATRDASVETVAMPGTVAGLAALTASAARRVARSARQRLARGPSARSSGGIGTIGD